MNFIQKAKKISKLSEIREKQLDEYENIYGKIKQHSNQCPKEIIGTLYKTDIDLFGYSFDTYQPKKRLSGKLDLY